MRCHRRSWIVAGVLSCLPLAASPLRAQGGNAPPATSAVARRDPPAGAVALTIEGGGSLGAYEAGMSWALVEALRQRRHLDETAPIAGGIARREASPLVRLPRLDLVTSAGASAGSINALLASISWCSAAPATVPESSS